MNYDNLVTPVMRNRSQSKALVFYYGFQGLCARSNNLHYYYENSHETVSLVDPFQVFVT